MEYNPCGVAPSHPKPFRGRIPRDVRLSAWKRLVVDRLADLRLVLHENRAQVRPVSAGIPWLGFVVFPTHRRLKRRNVVHYRRRLARLLEGYRIGEVTFQRLQASWKGWAQHAAYGDTAGLRRAVLGSVRVPARPSRPGPPSQAGRTLNDSRRR